MESALKMALKLVILFFAIASTLVVTAQSTHHDDVIENSQKYSRPYLGHGEFGHQLRWCCNNIIGWCCKKN
ncbi:transmembrane protein, putative [Medicago truncatula]|uniref:Transmembrane protein, putative n=1 Tax=Medicago truncatula TaxID=3880 RepID=A0A072TM31_MEDTR|nr:transmembrane protein, putative [Medicago truncatula]